MIANLLLPSFRRRRTPFRSFAALAGWLCLLAMFAAAPAEAQTLTVGSNPGAIVFNPVTNKYYVSATPMSVIDGATNTVTNLPGTVGFTASGWVGAAVMDVNTVTNKIYFLSNAGGLALSVIDGATNTVTNFPLGVVFNLAGVAVDSATNKIYVSVADVSGSVLVLDGATSTLLTKLSVGDTPGPIAVNPVTNKIYVTSLGSLAVIDGATNTITNVKLPTAAAGMVVNTATNKIYLATNPTCVVDGSTNAVTNLASGGSILSCCAYNPVTNIFYVAAPVEGNGADTTPGTVAAINGSTGAVTTIAVGIYPDAMAVDTATNTIMVANGFSNSITVINGVTNTAVTSPAGNDPAAIAVNPATNQFFVANSGGNTVSVIAGPVVTTSSPTIAVQTSPQTVAAGSTVVFNATVGGLPAPTLQWNLNGAPISGATSATLVISNSSSGNAGNYTLTATNASGVVTSSPVALSVSSTTSPGRLINLSILSFIQGSLSMGFVTGGAGTSGLEPLLIRGVGPSIGPGTAFAVPGVMTDPTLTVVGQTSHLTVASNSGWGIPASNASAVQTADAATGAFALTNTSSLDSAVVANLAGVGGGYSATVAGKSGDNGWALTEVYDDTAGYTPASTRLINLSCLTQIGTGGTLDVGFVIGGATSKTVLVRVGGPALNALYNIPGIMPDPQLQVSPLSNSATVLAFNAGWAGNPQIASAAASVGAYTFPSPSSLDSAALVTLPPGPYTVQVSSKTGLGGTVLVEIYEVP